MILEERHEIGTGDAGVLDTLELMAGVARSSSLEPVVREVAAGLVRGVGSDPKRQVARFRSWIRRYIEFLPDAVYAEELYRPAWMLAEVGRRRGGKVQGDCDDVATLAAALGLSIGLPARFVALLPVDPRQQGHVFAELLDPRDGEWLELDTTRTAQPMAALYRPPLVWEV